MAIMCTKTNTAKFHGVHFLLLKSHPQTTCKLCSWKIWNHMVYLHNLVLHLPFEAKPGAWKFFFFARAALDRSSIGSSSKAPVE